MFRPGTAPIPLDLAIELSALYAVRRARLEEIPCPVLAVIPSLRELAVATMLDNLLESGPGMLTLPPRYEKDMISMLPLDVPLSRVFCITEGSYWIRRYRHEFGCNNDLLHISDPRAFYLEALLSKLLLASSFDATDASDVSKHVNEVLELGGSIITRLILHIQARTVDLGAVFVKLPNLAHIQIVYDEPNIPPSSLLGTINTHKPSTSDLLVTSDALVMKGRSLPELSMDIKEPAAPFHNLPDYASMGLLLHRDVYGTTIPAGCLLAANKTTSGTPERLVELLDTFRYIQSPLQTISVISSALNSEAACVLAKGLQDMSFKLASTKVGHLSLACLDLSYNNIGDDAVRVLAKLFVDSEKHNLPAVITSLHLAANLVTKAGCAFLAKAISQPKSRLQALILNGNNIETDGYILLANGILKAAIKYSNNCLINLGLSGCGIVMDASSLRIIIKFIQHTSLECIDLGGNVFTRLGVQLENPGRPESSASASVGTRATTAIGDTNTEDACSDMITENLPLSEKEEGPLVTEFRNILAALKARYTACRFENGVIRGCGTPCVLTLPEDFNTIPEELYKELHEINHHSSMALESVIRAREASCENEDLYKPAVDIF